MPRGTRVNRRAAGYHQARITQLDTLDKAASYLLAMNWSWRKSQTSVSQKLIQMDCVAVAIVNNEWLIAQNSHGLTDYDVAQMATELGREITYAIVTRGTPNQMHAEMQVLEEIRASGYTNEQIQQLKVYMGVSKPCCRTCAEWLSHYNIGYANWHDSPVVNWEQPDMS
jgi:hypothetical protein